MNALAVTVCDDELPPAEVFWRNQCRQLAIKLGKLRDSVQVASTDKRADNRTGALGEIVFKDMYGLPLLIAAIPQGDGGVDFRVTAPDGRIVTIDIKTRRKPFYLLVQEKDMPRQADLTVLAYYNDATDWIDDWVGYATRDELARSTPRPFWPGDDQPEDTPRELWTGKPQYWVHSTRLHPLDEIDVMMEVVRK